MFKLLFIPQQKNSFQPYLLRKIALVFYSFLLVFVNYSPVFSQQENLKVYASSISTTSIINLANEDRKKYGLPELKQNLSLNTAAFTKANNMFDQQYWDHYGPNGETPWQFIKGAGYEYVYAGENLAKGFQTSEGVEQAWMASPTHRENLLSPNYKEIGVAVVSGNLKGENVILVVQMFGNLTSDIAEVNQNTKVVEGNVNNHNLENGEIKSIRIVSPGAGEVITNSKIQVEGETEFIKDQIKYNLSLLLNNKEVTKISSEKSEWEFVTDRNFPEGKNSMSVNVLEINGKRLADGSMTDEVEFIIDSTPPKISQYALNLSKSKSNQIHGAIVLVESDALLKVVIDQTEYGFAYDSKTSVYNAYFTVPDKFTKATLFAADKHGNTTQVDITSKVKDFKAEEAKKNDTGIVAGASTVPSSIGDSISGLFSIFSIKDLMNLGIAMFVLTLLGIEIDFYRKQGRLGERYHSVVFVVLWVLSVFLAVAGNLTGRIV
jgi:uncharacterized protein YkwD